MQRERAVPGDTAAAAQPGEGLMGGNVGARSQPGEGLQAATPQAAQFSAFHVPLLCMGAPQRGGNAA